MAIIKSYQIKRSQIVKLNSNRPRQTSENHGRDFSSSTSLQIETLTEQKM